jgi:hypothetical protein
VVEGVGKLELRGELPKGKLQESGGVWNESECLGMVPWLRLYRVRGRGRYKEEGSPDRGVVSLREGAS